MDYGRIFWSEVMVENALMMDFFLTDAFGLMWIIVMF